MVFPMMIHSKRDIISIDCGALKNNFYGDHAYTFAVGDIDCNRKNIAHYQASLYVGIDTFRAETASKLGYAVQTYCEKAMVWYVNWSVTAWAPLCTKNQSAELRTSVWKKFVDGMVLAIEPMINRGTHRIKQLKDGWTF